MSGQHTPAPWEARPNYGPLKSEIVAGGRAIATVWTKQASTREEQKEPVPWAEGEANARLIAAAPDLLAELQRVYDSLGGETYDWGPVRAAIAAATGEKR